MIPIKLILENFFSHKNSEIDFSNFSSALLIGNTEGDYSKSNGSGKSAIFEAILWCLFNKSRAAMMDDVIRWGELTCSVVLEFKHDNVNYMVKRSRNRMNSTSTVEFLTQDKAGDWQDISCSISGETNSKIESITKLDFKTFLNSVYFRQNDISEFAESEPSKKKEILKSIVDISRWDEYEKASRKKSRNINVECKVLKASVENHDSVIEKLESVNEESKEAKRQFKILSSKKETISDEIMSLTKRHNKIKISLDTDTFDRVVAELSSLRKTRDALYPKIRSLTASVKKHSEEKRQIEEKISVLNSKIKDKKYISDPKDRIEELRNQLAHYRIQKTSSKERLDSFIDDISFDSCHVCHQSIDKELQDRLRAEHEEERSHHKGLLSEANKEALELEKKIEGLLKIQQDNRELEDISAKTAALEYRLNLTEDELKKAKDSLGEMSIALDEVTFKIETNQEILESIKNEDFQALREKLKDLKTKREQVVSKISEKDRTIGMLAERASLLKEQEAKIRSNKKKIANRLEKIALFDKLSKLFGKGGIQTILLDSVIEDLEKTANTTLASICNEPAIIVLETQRLGSDGVSIIETLDLKVRKDGHLQNFKSLSGGEKFRISLALRIALSDISSRYGGSSLEFLLMDEVNSPLDRYGVETLFVNVIKSLEDKYKILVITHDESLKEKFDNVIDITKINGESELNFTTR